MDNKIDYSTIYQKRGEMLLHPEKHKELVAHFSAGGHGATVYSERFTAGELVCCWKFHDYQVTCPKCGGTAFITHWAGNVSSGGYWELKAYCPNCEENRLCRRHSAHWTRLREIAQIAKSLTADSATRIPNFLVVNEAFEREGWTMQHKFMVGNKWVKGNDTVTHYGPYYELNGEIISTTFLCEMLNIDMRLIDVCNAIAPHQLHSKYGRAFLEGVRWADAHPAGK